MKNLAAVSFDYTLCRQQVEEFRSWLVEKDELSERDDVLPFFRERRHMAVLFGMSHKRIRWADRFATEFDIFGDFASDLVVGEWDRGAYCLVEFEDATRNSIFKKQGKKATREWGRRFDHGYSQIIDWIRKLDGRSPSTDLHDRFGQYEISYEAVLVIGRDSHMDDGEKQRLNWRSDKVSVNTRKVFCLTFDELLSQFSTRMNTLAAVETSVTGATISPITSAQTPTSGRKPRRGKP